MINEADVVVGIGGAAGDGVASAGNTPGLQAGPLVHQPVAVSREQRRTLLAEFM